MTADVSDQSQQPPSEPVEDPTSRGTLGQFAKKGAEGVQVLAVKMTGQEDVRCILQQPGHALSQPLHECCICSAQTCNSMAGLLMLW